MADLEGAAAAKRAGRPTLFKSYYLTITTLFAAMTCPPTISLTKWRSTFANGRPDALDSTTDATPKAAARHIMLSTAFPLALRMRTATWDGSTGLKKYFADAARGCDADFRRRGGKPEYARQRPPR